MEFIRLLFIVSVFSVCVCVCIYIYIYNFLKEDQGWHALE